MLLGKRAGEAEVSDLHDAFFQRVQDVVGLYISVQHVVFVHLLQAEGRLV